jgi:catechol 2,3-dioxygenase-like lactoylglutathione lyase family enzyme
MSTPDTTSQDTSASDTPKPGEVRLEVVAVPVSDVDRAKAFYESLGWRLDIDIEPSEAVRIVQFTPPGSGCSIAIGTGITPAEPGSFQGSELAVLDIDAAREDLIGRGIEVSDLYHLDGGPKPGPDPEGQSYRTFASFKDPDGNTWQLQEIRERLPGR